MNERTKRTQEPTRKGGAGDTATIAEVIQRCQRDADARDYFTGRAAATRHGHAGPIRLV